jgi:energy-coupling factor transporter ATP-binding protein EcfA2
MAGYDVFLSYNKADRPAVDEIARQLVKAGIQPWLDEWNLIPGDLWQEAIEEALGSCTTCAVLVGPSGTGPWQNEEMRAAIDRRVSEGKGTFRVIPVLLPGAQRGERSKLPTFLVATTWVEFRQTLDDEDAFHRLISGIRGQAPGPGPGQAIYEDVCPYRGLQFFDVEHAPFFFGREALTEWLLDELRGDNRFLAIVGPSGSGKSSLARAGLVAALKEGRIAGSGQWPVIIARPGADPLESLAVALSDVTGTESDPVATLNLIKSLREDERTLHLMAGLLLRSAPPEQRLVILEDQFEELFTLCHDDDLQQALINNLTYAAGVTQGRTTVVLAFRADFYGRYALYPRLAEALSDHQVLVGPMSQDELRLSIERPAQLVGLEFEPGLVEVLLRDVQGQPGSLPLLQHALLELWERRKGRRLSHADYEVIGGVEGALERRAEAVFAQLTESEQEVCRQIFLRLIQPGKGTEDTKRRVELGEMLRVEESTAKQVETVVQKLADEKARLVTTRGEERPGGQRSVEVAHETLIRRWERLREWIEINRESLRLHRQLTEDSQEWEKHDRHTSYLYKGLQLEGAKKWVTDQLPILNPSERDFIFHSIIEDGTDLEDWIPRYGDLEGTLPLIDEYLTSKDFTQRRKGLLILRWVTDPTAGDEIRSLLLNMILTDDSQIVSNRAAEVLCERGQVSWLCDQVNSSVLSAQERSILISAVAHTRNLPKLGAAVNQYLNGRHKRQVLRTAAWRLFLDHRSQFAIVFSFSFVASQIGLEIVSRIGYTIERFWDIESVGLPYGITNLVIPITFGLYILLRAHLDEQPPAIASCLFTAFLGTLVSESIFLSGRIIEETVVSITRATSLLPELSILVIDVLNTAASILIVVLFLRTLPTKRKIISNAFWYSLFGSGVATFLKVYVNPFLYDLCYGFPTSLSLDVLSTQVVASIYTWFLGFSITFTCLLGCYLGIRVSYGEKLFYQKAKKRVIGHK